MKPFEQIDISGDAGIRAFGRELTDIFVNAALGMYSLVTEPAALNENKKIEVAVQSDSTEGLLVAWLNELVFHLDTYGFVGKNIIVHQFRGNEIRAEVRGEDFDPARHEGKLLIKAATYHKLRIEKKEGKWEADIIFDI